MAFEHNSKVAEQEPAWADVDKTKLPRVAFAEKGDEKEKFTWKYPHHFVQGGGELDESGVYTSGTLYLHKGGLAAARAAAAGARSGEEASEEVKSHLAAHAKAIGMGEPAPSGAAEQADLAEVEIAEFPCVDQKGRRWEEKTGHELVATFAEFGGKELKPPAVLGHNERTDLEGKPIEGATGMPALGWVKSLAMKGAKLVAAIGQVPAVVADLVHKGAYKRISGSWWPDGEAAGIPGAKGRAVLRHVGLLGADTPRIKTLADVQALYQGEAPAAALTDDAQADVAEFVDVAPAAETKPPENLKEAIQTEATRDRLQPVIQAIHSRLWIIQEQHGRSDVDIVAALKELAAELAKFLAAYEPSPGAHSPEELAAASMAAGAGGAAAPKPSDAPGSPQGVSAGAGVQPGAVRPTGEKPATPIGPVAAMSDAARDQIATFVARLTGEGRLAPKHAPAIRAQAAACFAQGGEEALAAYLDDQDGLRKSKVVPLGESGKAGAAPETSGGAAEFADPAADAAAVEEFDRLKLGRSLGITREQYVAARRTVRK